MRVLRHTTDVPAEFQGSVAVLGNFDGVHRGHQAVIGIGRALADAMNAPLAVVTFEPHPRSFFAPGAPPFRLTSLRSKARLLAALKVDVTFALHFDRVFSEQPAETFVQEVLVRGLGIRHAVIGYDFVFGHRRSGNAALLRRMGETLGFGVRVVEPVVAHDAGGETYASTRIRDLLTAGEPQAAAALLGHWWEIDGRVEAGDQRGRTIGFPTANVGMNDFLEPRLGVYAVRAGLESGTTVTWHDAVANIGRRPTVGGERILLEVHLFDHGADLYGRHLRVALVEFLRPERKFSGLEALKAQIAEDARAARAVLAAPQNRADRFPLSLTVRAGGD